MQTSSMVGSVMHGGVTRLTTYCMMIRSSVCKETRFSPTDTSKHFEMRNCEQAKGISVYVFQGKTVSVLPCELRIDEGTKGNCGNAVEVLNGLFSWQFERGEYRLTKGLERLHRWEREQPHARKILEEKALKKLNGEKDLLKTLRLNKVSLI